MAHPYSSAAAPKRRRSLMPQPWKQPESGMYYLRLRVPAELRPVLGHEFKRSLNTRSPAEAKARYPEKLLAAQQAFARAREQAAGKELLTDRDIEQLAARWYRDEAVQMEEQGAYGAWLVQGESVEVQEGATVRSVPVMKPLREAVEEEEDFGLPKLVSRIIDQSLRDHSIPKPRAESAAWKKLEAAFREHLFKLSDLAYERQQGNWGGSQAVLGPEPLTLERGTSQGPLQGMRLLALFEKYAEDKRLNDGDNRSVRKTVDAYRNIVEQFIELCGDLPVEKINRETVRDYRALLVRLPSKGEGIRGLCAKALIAKADNEDLPRITAPTVRNKLRALSAVLSYSVRMGQLAENPVIAGGIGRAAAKTAMAQKVRSRRRKDYTRDEIAAIFSSPVYSSDWTPARADFGEAWYWMPLLMYYTGARREELAQLAARDVKFSDDDPMIPYIGILETGDDDDGRGVKTVGSRRVIPLHDDLVSRGFLDYAKSVPRDGQLFPLLKPNPQGFYGANFGKRWGMYLRDVAQLKSGARPSHGFRHTFKTLCREAGIQEDVHDAMTGHVGGGKEARGYGEMPLTRMAEELQKYPPIGEPSTKESPSRREEIQGL
jgi:integrase